MQHVVDLKSHVLHLHPDHSLAHHSKLPAMACTQHLLHAAADFCVFSYGFFALSGALVIPFDVHCESGCFPVLPWGPTFASAQRQIHVAKTCFSQIDNAGVCCLAFFVEVFGCG